MLGMNEQQDEELKESVTKSENMKNGHPAGTSENQKEKLTEMDRSFSKMKSTDISETRKTKGYEISQKSDTESAKLNIESQNYQYLESKCCKKKCLYVVNLQVQEKLNQEYKEQSNQSMEHGQSYLCKYIYSSKKEKSSNGAPKNMIYHYRIPRQLCFQEDETRKEICEKAFLKIFEVDEWVLRCAQEECGKCK